MGLHNYICCRYPLPDPVAQDLMFQTKSMPDRSVATYEVTLDGLIVARNTRTDGAAEPESEPLPRSLEYVPGKPLPVQGELEIYTPAERADGSRCWYSYRLNFRDGRVIGVQRGADCGQILPQPQSESEP